MADDYYHTDSVLIVYPQERFALQAIEQFDAYGLSFETIEPPAHLLDVACPAVKVSRSLFGEVQEVSKKEKLFHIGIVDWRPAGPDADRVERLPPGPEPPLLETVQMTFIAACMADDTKLRFIAQFDRDISKVMPYMNPTVKGAVYTPNIPALGECPHIYLAEYEEKRTALLTLFPGLEAEGGSGAPA